MSASTKSRRSGFTLVELLIIVVIIGLLIGLLFPALSGARSAARKASTQSLLSNIKTGVAQFRSENRRLPGYFSQEQMGQTSNIPSGLRGGFTNMQNALLDLAGGVRTDLQPNQADSPTGNNPPARIAVGPTNNNEKVVVDRSALGAADSGSYLELPPDAFTSNPDVGPAGDPANRWMPNIHDSYGQPVVMWSINEAAGGDSQFAAINAPSNPAAPSSQRAKFYWASNAGVFQSESLGSRRPVSQLENSLLSTRRANNSRIGTMFAILGNPAFPVSNDGLIAFGNPTAVVPAAARGDVVLHSAGQDSIFVNKFVANEIQADWLQYIPDGLINVPEQAKTFDQDDDIISAGS